MKFEINEELIEKLILKRAITDKRWLDNFSKIYDRRWFSNKTIQHLMSCAVKFYIHKNEMPTRATLVALAQNNGKFTPEQINESLNSLQGQELNMNNDFVDENIENFIKDRGLYYSIIQNAEDVMNNHNVDAILDSMKKIQTIQFEDPDIGMDYFSPEGMKEHWDYIMNPEAKISTGFVGLDRYMNGGILREGKDLTCFVAQAGLGKSLFLSNCAVNFLKQNLSVVVISLEMSENVYAKRFSAHISNSNINRLAQNKDTALASIKKFYEDHPECHLYIKEYPPRSIRTAEIEHYLENLIAAGKKFDVIVIDYLNLVLSSRKSDNMYESVLAVSEELRALSYKFEAPILTATQATTDGMNNEDIGMEHVSESRGICHTVDQLFALYQLDDDRECGQINLKILKNRAGGEVGKKLIFKVAKNCSLLVDDITFSPNTDRGENMSESQNLLDNLDSGDVESDISSLVG